MTSNPLGLAAVYWEIVAVGCWFIIEQRTIGYHLAGTLALAFALLAVLWFAYVGEKPGMLQSGADSIDLPIIIGFNVRGRLGNRRP